VSLYSLDEPADLVAPTMLAAFDSWVDAGSAATAAAGRVAGDGDVVATFDADTLFDYRARRPTLRIVDGRLTELVWPELVVRRSRIDGRDLLVITGPEPDFRWVELSAAVVELATRLGVRDWVSLGAIPAAVPHTRPVPILGTESREGLLRGDVQPGPAGILQVPAALVSVIEVAISQADIPAVGYFAQVPHYVSGRYPAAAAELLRALGRHLGIDLPAGPLLDEGDRLRLQLDAATGADETTRAYVGRLEAMVDEQRLPSGDDLISEIERFLREGGGEGSQRS
jgi:hypothetical protein